VGYEQRRVDAWRAIGGDFSSYCADCNYDQLTERVCAAVTPDELATRTVVTHSVGKYLPELFTSPQYPLGWCPVCARYDGKFNIVDDHFGVCHAHKIAWWRGRDVHDHWLDEDEAVWRRNFVQTCDYDFVGELLDWTPLASAFEEVGLALPQPNEGFLTWEQQWLLGQTGRWEPPYVMVDHNTRETIVLTREECRDRDEAETPRRVQQVGMDEMPPGDASSRGAEASL